jgi:uncharacterized membrane protein (DUF485 family)
MDVKLLTLWLQRISQNHREHHRESVKAGKWAVFITIMIIHLSVISSFGSFLNINNFPKKLQIGITISVGILSMVSALLTAIDKYLNFSGDSFQHKAMANEYSDLSNKIQQKLCRGELIEEKRKNLFRIISDRINVIQRFGPGLIDNQQMIADIPMYLLRKDDKFLESTVEMDEVKIESSEYFSDGKNEKK